MEGFFEFYIKYHNRFIYYFNKTLKDKGMEDIHQMRLSVKKLRAIWSLMEIISNFEWSKRPHFDLVAPLFSYAGDLREVQVNMSLLKRAKSKKIKPYIKYLNRKEQRAWKRLIKMMDKFDLNQFDALTQSIPESIIYSSSDTIWTQSANYINSIADRVKRLKKKLPNTKKMHKIRIQLKAFHQVLLLMKEFSKDEELKKLQKKIKSINTKIGEWHDYVELTSSISDFRKGEKGKKRFQKTLKRLTKRIQARQKVREKKLQQLIDASFKKKQLQQIEQLVTSEY